MRPFIPVIAAFAIGAAAFFTSAPEAQAWGCEARANVGNSRGWSYGFRNRSDASRRALRECAARTQRGRVCRITYCDPSR
jgi:hypothetical protein